MTSCGYFAVVTGSPSSLTSGSSWASRTSGAAAADDVQSRIAAAAIRNVFIMRVAAAIALAEWLISLKRCALAKVD
jgi:hypothetical protein